MSGYEANYKKAIANAEQVRKAMSQEKRKQHNHMVKKLATRKLKRTLNKNAVEQKRVQKQLLNTLKEANKVEFTETVKKATDEATATAMEAYKKEKSIIIAQAAATAAFKLADAKIVAALEKYKRDIHSKVSNAVSVYGSLLADEREQIKNVYKSFAKTARKGGRRI
jgi:hypothetical protein